MPLVRTFQVATQIILETRIWTFLPAFALITIPVIMDSQSIFVNLFPALFLLCDDPRPTTN